jgi:predicted metal-dependent enzyme (double-stranded beta helix superfamily)
VFDVDDLIASCRACLDEPEPRRAVREVLERVTSDGEAVADALRPERAGITMLHNTPELTVINVVWAPGMRLHAHDHQMWAVISVYSGREDNEFFRRPVEAADGLVPSNGRSLDAGDVIVLGDDTIHAVSNPKQVPTGGIHVYGGDFVRQPRSMWRPPDLAEEPYDPQVVDRVFTDANTTWLGTGRHGTH